MRHSDFILENVALCPAQYFTPQSERIQMFGKRTEQLCAPSTEAGIIHGNATLAAAVRTNWRLENCFFIFQLRARDLGFFLQKLITSVTRRMDPSPAPPGSFRRHGINNGWEHFPQRPSTCVLAADR